ncbi:aminotransferase class I/II-fold pyridoxal phosphate-dependent enzyme [Pedobacter chitinilyticus]|uniref:Pyridoxal phosphate-dependent aminotransferase family protein n=1 Tax=Pedobacter chitinilyticus TaxID=2233776 RepID=A0A3S3QFQ9_9SPHI|nr:aminotransferase class I/II-fold pyridoxal phosphate-dependent enzyme [Pedobacter chitinilyticus]RWU07655.1 pyridoxal phosphate-dependent aminotransferase family protein [Pedobacter chitinilyticus]
MSTQEHFNHLNQKLSATIAVSGNEYLYFGGTAYLGIPQNKDFISLYIEGIERYGLNNGTSRGNNVQLGIYDEAEAFIAQKYGAEAALISSSGYLSAKLVVQHYATYGNIRYAPNSHPALWLKGDPKNNLAFEDWSKQIVEEINSSEAEKWVLLSNSMNNLYPEIYDFGFLQEISPAKKIVLIVDDSHGIGILNAGIGALPNVPKLEQIEVIVVASMAKALGLDAGLVLGSKQAIQQLKQSDEFYGASPPAAAGLYAFINANDIYHKAYQKLQDNVKKTTSLLQESTTWHYVDGFPVFLCKQEGVAQQLLEEKILISSFPYPDRNGKILNRIVLSSWHSEADISKLVSALKI